MDQEQKPIVIRTFAWWRRVIAIVAFLALAGYVIYSQIQVNDRLDKMETSLYVVQLASSSIVQLGAIPYITNAILAGDLPTLAQLQIQIQQLQAKQKPTK